MIYTEILLLKRTTTPYGSIELGIEGNIGRAFDPSPGAPKHPSGATFAQRRNVSDIPPFPTGIPPWEDDRRIFINANQWGLWWPIRWTVVNSEKREGRIIHLEFLVRAQSSAWDRGALYRSVVLLDGVTSEGTPVGITRFLENYVLDVVHPNGGPWTYDDLDRVEIGFSYFSPFGETLATLTRFYPTITIDPDIAPGPVTLGVPGLVTALEL